MINLSTATDPFIPTILRDGGAYHLSLRDLFERAEEITDLSLSPHERISVLRLLLCISQAALADELTYDDDIPTARDKLQSAALDYLNRWEKSFDLFGDGTRFLQLRTAKTDTTSTAKLDLTLASGNNPTLFDHEALGERQLSAQELALSLIAFQNFSPLIGRGYKGRGPAVEHNMRHSFLHGANLLETLSLNLLSLETLEDWPGEGLGRPVWELPPNPSEPDSEACLNATSTYLGRLCPLARSVWLVDGARMILDNGLIFPGPEEILESSAATRLVKVSKTSEKVVTLSVRPDRAAWRELDALLSAQKGCRRPLSLRNIRREKAATHALWTGGLVTDYKAKIENAASSLFSGEIALPAELLDGSVPDAAERYRDAVEAANSWAYALGRATGHYASLLKLDGDPFRVPAQADFWQRLEQHLPDLFRFAIDPSQNISSDEKHRGFSFSSTNPYLPALWHQTAKKHAHTCYRRACDPDQSRNIIAHVQGQKKLWPVDPDKKGLAEYLKELKSRENQ